MDNITYNDKAFDTNIVESYRYELIDYKLCLVYAI